MSDWKIYHIKLISIYCIKHNWGELERFGIYPLKKIQMKLQTLCIHNYLALNHDNKTKCHLNKRRTNKSTFCSKKHQNPHIVMVMQLQKKHVKNWHSHKWQFERTKFKLLKLHSYLRSCAHFLDIVMAFTHNKSHIGTLFHNTIHIEIIFYVHIFFQLLK